MCIHTDLQQKIARLTNNGETIVQFLADTLQSNASDIKRCHKLDAARMLAKYGFTSPHHGNITSMTPLLDEDREECREEDWAEDWAEINDQDEYDAETRQPKSEPTLYDIIAYPTARYIRDRTNEGETLIEALREIIHDNGEFDSESEMGFRSRSARPPAKPHHKIAAANELLRRALGESATRRRSASYDPEADLNDADPLNGHLAKLVRDKTNDGAEAAEMLIRIAENDRSVDDWTSAHRVSAARELLHRAYDLNYEAVIWAHVQAYKQATDFADDGATLEHARVQAGRRALLHEFNDAYESGDEEAAQRAEDKYNAYNHYIIEGKNPEDAMKYAVCGANDPIPDELHTQNPTNPVTSARPAPILNAAEEPLEEPLEGHGSKHTAAAQIPTPRLTVPINNRSP